MAEVPDSNNQLNIRCPSCRQRFEVDKSLMDRMVECGGCDSRFRINSDVIVRTKKFYPGEGKDPKLNRFQRVPLSGAGTPEGFQTAQYAEFKHPEQLGPASPQRVIAGVLGVGLMIFTAILFLFSTRSGGMLGGTTLENRLVIAGFVCVVGLAMLIYANPRARFKAAFFGLLLAAGVISLPFFHKDGPRIADSSGTNPPKVSESPIATPEEIDPTLALRERFGTKPLEDEQQRMESLGDGKSAYGVYLTGLVQRNIYTARDFLIRDTGAGPSSHPYPRDDGNYLMVLTEVPLSLEEVAAAAGKLGQTQEVLPELGLVVVRVNNEQFLASSSDKLNDKSDPAFYDLNRLELESIDLDRVKRAVDRLADAEPSIFRTDISRRFIELMAKRGVTFHDSIARALLVWSETPGPAGLATHAVVRGYIAEGLPVPENLVALIVKEKTTEAIPELNTLWIQSPSLWERHFKAFGSDIEPYVVEQIDAAEAPLRRSALKLLGEIGTNKSLPAIRKAASDTDPEVRTLATRAIAEIQSR